MAMLSTNFDDRAPRRVCQLDLLAGNDDPLISLVNARIMRALRPNASLHVFDDGHLGLITAADELGPVVSRFLTSQAGEGAETNQGT
jgi:pimeloyl-ACP methyl ester carboxylesterase